jgi:hypothetical protein
LAWSRGKLPGSMPKTFAGGHGAGKVFHGGPPRGILKKTM